MIPGMASQVRDPVLIGRRAEIHLLDDALDAAAAGRPAMLLVGGEAGVGKTRLLGELRGRAPERGFLVSRGRPEPRLRSRSQEVGHRDFTIRSGRELREVWVEAQDDGLKPGR